MKQTKEMLERKISQLGIELFNAKTERDSATVSLERITREAMATCRRYDAMGDRLDKLITANVILAALLTIGVIYVCFR